MANSRPVIIFGLSDNAQLANFYLTNDSDHTVAGFCVDQKHMPENLEYMGYNLLFLQ